MRWSYVRRSWSGVTGAPAAAPRPPRGFVVRGTALSEPRTRRGAPVSSAASSVRSAKRGTLRRRSTLPSPSGGGSLRALMRHRRSAATQREACQRRHRMRGLRWQSRQRAPAVDLSSTAGGAAAGASDAASAKLRAAEGAAARAEAPLRRAPPASRSARRIAAEETRQKVVPELSSIQVLNCRSAKRVAIWQTPAGAGGLASQRARRPEPHSGRGSPAPPLAPPPAGPCARRASRQSVRSRPAPAAQ